MLEEEGGLFESVGDFGDEMREREEEKLEGEHHWLFAGLMKRRDKEGGEGKKSQLGVAPVLGPQFFLHHVLETEASDSHSSRPS